MDNSAHFIEIYLSLAKEWEEVHRESGIRFGQFVINSGRLAEFIKTPNPEIFYETDLAVVQDKLLRLCPAPPATPRPDDFTTLRSEPKKSRQ
jgi:hypothetical protein